MNWLKNPHNRVHAAWGLFWVTFVCWPLTHAMILVTHPPELSSWTGHLLLALSWFAITSTAVNIIVTTDVRDEQENGEDQD